MREILFRGKDITGNWYAGNLAVVKENMHNGAGTIEAGSYISNEYGKPFAYQVRPETIGQFTGLVDKNGKKIFEGDIYVTDYNQHTLKNNVQVLSVGGAFCGGKTCLRCSPLAWESKEDDEELYLDEEFLNHIVVIGNIHDNPELVEA